MNQTFQQKNIYKDFDLSFGRNPLTNDVSVKTDINAISQSVKTLIYTNFYERPFQPNVGSNVRDILFEPADNITVSDLRYAVREVIGNYEPRIVVKDVIVMDMSDMNAYSVVIIYSMVNKKEPIELKVTLKRLR